MALFQLLDRDCIQPMNGLVSAVGWGLYSTNARPCFSCWMGIVFNQCTALFQLLDGDCIQPMHGLVSTVQWGLYSANEWPCFSCWMGIVFSQCMAQATRCSLLSIASSSTTYRRPMHSRSSPLILCVTSCSHHPSP